MELAMAFNKFQHLRCHLIRQKKLARASVHLQHFKYHLILHKSLCSSRAPLVSRGRDLVSSVVDFWQGAGSFLEPFQKAKHEVIFEAPLPLDFFSGMRGQRATTSCQN